MTPNKWDYRFLGLAQHVSLWSKDPSTQVGAVIGKHNKIISIGYNGFPQKIDDNERLLDRNFKLQIVLHAEENAILQAQQDLTGCSIYTWPFMPCAHCASLIVQTGIAHVVAPINNNPRWADSFCVATNLFTEANISLQLVSEDLISKFLG